MAVWLWVGDCLFSERLSCYLRCQFWRVSSYIYMSFQSPLWLEIQSFSLNSLLLFSNYLTMLMLQTSLYENCSLAKIGDIISLSLCPFFITLDAALSLYPQSPRPCCPCIPDSNSMCWLALVSQSVRLLICFLSQLIALFRGSSFTVGWLVMQEALVAQVSVEIFSQINKSLGHKHAIIRQQLFPPMDCLRIEVNFESLYGTYALSFWPLLRDESARIVITCLKVKSDLLMSILSLA